MAIEKEDFFLITIMFVCVGVMIFSFGRITGFVTDDFMGSPEQIGPTEEEIQCMQSCVAIGCEQEDQTCMEANSHACGEQCGVPTEAPVPEDESEACMQECVIRGCSEYDFQCQNNKRASCEVECDMLGDAPDQSEMGAEELCISECVAKEDPTVICGNSQEGETGNSLCQRCANSCVHLYEGPCLDDEKLTQKEEACKTCDHCYGEPITGPSGQGWDCIIDVECKDASAEFGDEPGTDPGIEESPIKEITTGIVDFFKGLFGL